MGREVWSGRLSKGTWKRAKHDGLNLEAGLGKVWSQNNYWVTEARMLLVRTITRPPNRLKVEVRWGSPN